MGTPVATPSTFDSLAERLEDGIELLLASILERLRKRKPSWGLASSFSQDQIAAFYRASLETQLRFFRLGALPEECSEVDAGAARAVAPVGELGGLLNGYSACQSSLMDAWLELVDATTADSRERRRLLRRGSDFFPRYMALLSDHVAGVYQREIEASSHNGERRRFQAIRAVLEGSPPDDWVGNLDFNLDQYHLGLLAWGEGADDGLRRLATALERPFLLIGPLNGAWWAWISGSRSFEVAEERVLQGFQPPEGTAIAIGLPAYGEAGFRATHRQAQRAHWASRHSERSLNSYADLAVESLASENPEEARRFVARELGGIDDDSTKSREIRETLIAYFESEHNAASAAAKLGIHQQTVANRIRAVEERIGRPVGARRVELEVALRLRVSLAGVEP
jgi:PucR C-terminal helix-turn-helix domain/GGDEF-like domain